MSCSLTVSPRTTAASGADLDLDAADRGLERGQQLDSTPRTAVELHGRALQHLLAGVETREAQQVLHQALHAPGVAIDDLEETLASSGAEGASISAST